MLLPLQVPRPGWAGKSFDVKQSHCFKIYNIPHNSTLVDNPMVLNGSGGVKRAHDQMAIDGFLKPKRARTESSDPDIQFVEAPSAAAKEVQPVVEANADAEAEKENVPPAAEAEPQV